MSYLYPYGDTQQLNLSWFLAKFKELYDYITNLDPDDIALTTVLSRFTNEYNSSTNYIPGDYVIHEGFIYKANQSTTGNFNPQAWDAALPVNDIQGLRILLGGLSTDLDALEQNAVTNVQYTPGAATADGLLRQTINGAAETVMTVDKEPTENSQNPVKSGSVFTKISKKADYVDLGAITGTTKEEAIENAYRSISNYDNPILFKFSWSGQWSGIAYKYSASNYGTIYATFPVNNASFFGYMINDVFHVDQVARESEITSLLGSLNDIKGQPLYGKKILCIGDSYMSGSDGDTVYGVSWATNLQNYGATVTLCRMHGAGYVATATQSATYPNETFVQALEHYYGQEFDYIITQNGYNDIMNTSTTVNNLKTAIKTYFDNAKSHFPKAKLYAFGLMKDVFLDVDHTNKVMAIQQALNENGIITCKKSWNWFLYTGMNSADGVHITQEAYSKLKEYVAAFLQGWNGDIDKPYYSFSTSGNNSIFNPINCTVNTVEIRNMADDWVIVYMDITITSNATSGTVIVGDGLPCCFPQQYLNTKARGSSDFVPNLFVRYNGELCYYPIGGVSLENKRLIIMGQYRPSSNTGD